MVMQFQTFIFLKVSFSLLSIFCLVRYIRCKNQSDATFYYKMLHASFILAGGVRKGQAPGGLLLALGLDMKEETRRFIC